MDFDFEQLRAAFGEQSTTFVDLVHNTRDLSTPTALEGWDCAVLIGHVSTAVEALTRWQADHLRTHLKSTLLPGGTALIPE